MALTSRLEILMKMARNTARPGSHRLRFLTLSRYRIALLVTCLVLVLVLVLPVLPQDTHRYTNWTSILQTPATTQSPDTSPSLLLSQLLFPLPSDPADGDHSWIAENERTITSLLRCVEQGNCGANQTKVVILTAGDFRGLLYGMNGGEAIWANSTIIALRRLGYSYLYAINQAHTSQLYNIFREIVPLIIFNVPDDTTCFHDQECVLTKNRPHGIPAWKIFSFHFWDSPANPLGKKWTMSPENVKSSGNTYLGYSIEPQCARQAFIPHQHRPRHGYILAKEAGYFTHKNHAFSPDVFEAASAAAEIQLFAGVRESVLPDYFPSNITNVGFLSSAKLYETLANSRVLVGIGIPTTSPTPYEALCLGVPFINPILQWDANNPTDKKRWLSQHMTLKSLHPPYVYNVFKGDKAGFVKAVVDATSNPIQSFVLEDMRMKAVEARLANILETDWKAEGAKVLDERKASGSGETFSP
ncbi:hypothetical protein B0H16DRAFT_1535994 [Mycena metata]|uniref:Glycosyltransferase family 18 catalytic domain-containing protein n=1 Tax=Mycena metata TaxID=1033252 RepID=A0AAD7NFC4_9AGAR|nr:hypothetical protein B0H16DRAFT_1535994 [Mycena metata]